MPYHNVPSCTKATIAKVSWMYFQSFTVYAIKSRMNEPTEPAAGMITPTCGRYLVEINSMAKEILVLCKPCSKLHAWSRVNLSHYIYIYTVFRSSYLMYYGLNMYIYIYIYIYTIDQNWNIKNMNCC